MIPKLVVLAFVSAAAHFSSASHAEAQEMLPLENSIYQAVSLGRSSGRNYPAHVAIIDASVSPMNVYFPNLRCSGQLLNKRYPDRARFSRWPVLSRYEGLSQFELKITRGICVLSGHIVLHHGKGGNCLFGCADVNMTYFYFGADGAASGSKMTENRDGLAMTTDDAIDLIDLARTQ